MCQDACTLSSALTLEIARFCTFPSLSQCFDLSELANLSMLDKHKLSTDKAGEYPQTAKTIARDERIPVIIILLYNKLAIIHLPSGRATVGHHRHKEAVLDDRDAKTAPSNKKGWISKPAWIMECTCLSQGFKPLVMPDHLLPPPYPLRWVAHLGLTGSMRKGSRRFHGAAVQTEVRINQKFT